MARRWTVNYRELKWFAKHEHEWHSLNEIAHGLDVAPSTLSRALNGKSEPGQALLAALRVRFSDEAFAAITAVVDDELTNGASA